MALDTYAKNKVRSTLLLELNNCFTTVSKHYTECGSESDREFLQTLIASIKECVQAKARESDPAIF